MVIKNIIFIKDIEEIFNNYYKNINNNKKYYFNNSIKALQEGGSLFIDDILPLSYNEQLKIPRKHYYEKGILKYGEEWTGDIWKVVYHILKKYSRLINEFKYFYNSNYRGIAYIKIKESFEILETEIDVINGYDYFIDFPKYLTLLALSK